jgi:DNA-binding MarR family transcriptional regulator
MHERPLRATAAANQGLEDTLAAPKGADSLAEIDRALGKLVSRDRRQRFQQRLAERVGLDLSPGAVWSLARFDTYGIEPTRELARERGIEPERIAAVTAELRERDLMTGEDGAAQLTPAGHAVAEQVMNARREALEELLADQPPDRPPEVQDLLRRLSVELAGQRP